MVIRRLNKKGDVRTLPGVALVGTILALAVIVLVLFIAGKFTGLFFSEKNQELAINNFIALSNRIETLSKSRNQFDAQRNFPFYLPSNFVIVGFNRRWNDRTNSDGCEPEPVRKPSVIDGQEGKKCRDSACICLFGDRNDHFTKGKEGQEYNVELIQCRSLPEVDYIIIPYLKESKEYPSQIYKNFIGEKIPLTGYPLTGFNNYAFSYIYGQCDDHYWDKNLESRKLYIEKFTNEGGIPYILIAPEHEGVKIIEDRYKAMNEKYGKTS